MYTTKYLAKCSFSSSQIYLKTIFYTAQSLFYILTENLNTNCTPHEMKQNMLHWVFFRQDFCKFCEVTKYQWRLSIVFFCHTKSVFNDDREQTEKDYTSASFQEDHQ